MDGSEFPAYSIDFSMGYLATTIDNIPTKFTLPRMGVAPVENECTILLRPIRVQLVRLQVLTVDQKHVVSLCTCFQSAEAAHFCIVASSCVCVQFFVKITVFACTSGENVPHECSQPMHLFPIC